MELEKDETKRAVGALLVLNKVSQSQFDDFVDRLTPELRQPCRNAIFNVRKNLEFISKTIYNRNIEKCDNDTKQNYNDDFFTLEDLIIKFIEE